MKFIDEIPNSYWQGKRVLLRVGFDMGKDYSAMEEFRITAGFKTIKFLMERKARLVLLNHNGRPEGKVAPELSNAKIAVKLSCLLEKEVPLFPLDTNPFSLSLPLVFLENLRFDPGEEANSLEYAKGLARFGEVYVNDAFSNSHRAHASMVGIPSLLPHFGGLQLKGELEVLGKARNYPSRPLVLIMGGVKMETKLKIVKYFWEKAQDIILGGALANMFLHVKGLAIGKSLIEPEYLEETKEVSLTDIRLHLPVDVRVAKDFEGRKGIRVAAVGNLEPDEFILDIGPDTQLLFDNIIKSAKMIIWNGPMGKCEVPEFSGGTIHLVKSLNESHAKVITGGGETVELIEREGLLDKFYFVSTGGGAMLTFLAGERMPALAALE